MDFLSPWRGGRQPMQGDPEHSRLSEKNAGKRRENEAGGGAVGTPPPLDPSDGGGRFHRKGASGSELLTRPPGRSRRRGRQCRRNPPSRINHLASGTATNRDEPPLFNAHEHACSCCQARAALIASRTSPALVTLLPATSRITSPSLKPRFGGPHSSGRPRSPRRHPCRRPATLLGRRPPSCRASATSAPLIALPPSSLPMFGLWPRPCSATGRASG